MAQMKQEVTNALLLANPDKYFFTLDDREAKLLIAELGLAGLFSDLNASRTRLVS